MDTTTPYTPKRSNKAGKHPSTPKLCEPGFSGRNLKSNVRLAFPVKKHRNCNQQKNKN
jgi:hypothetical protein